jgi:hypothetical protein
MRSPGANGANTLSQAALLRLVLQTQPRSVALSLVVVSRCARAFPALDSLGFAGILRRSDNGVFPGVNVIWTQIRGMPGIE